MGDYTSNFAALLTGHLDLPSGDPTTGGGKGNVTSTTYIPQGRTPANDYLDIRDTLAHVIAGGYTDFSNKDVQANYSRLAHLIGASRAERLFVQAFSFNQKPGMNKRGGEEKIQQFYDLGSSDPETNKTMLAVKNIGYGVKEGFRTSVNDGVRLLSGAETPVANPQPNPDMTAVQTVVNKKLGQ